MTRGADGGPSARADHKKDHLQLHRSVMVVSGSSESGTRSIRGLVSNSSWCLDPIRAADPSLGWLESARRIRKRFGIPVHPRSVERAWARHQKSDGKRRAEHRFVTRRHSGGAVRRAACQNIPDSRRSPGKLTAGGDGPPSLGLNTAAPRLPPSLVAGVARDGYIIVAGQETKTEILT